MIQLEWEQTFEKVRANLSKLARQRAKLEDAKEDTGPELPLLPGEAPGPGTFTPRQKQIQQQILMRRGIPRGPSQ